jgi:hypothetical protein
VRQRLAIRDAVGFPLRLAPQRTALGVEQVDRHRRGAEALGNRTQRRAEHARRFDLAGHCVADESSEFGVAVRRGRFPIRQRRRVAGFLVDVFENREIRVEQGLRRVEPGGERERQQPQQRTSSSATTGRRGDPSQSAPNGSGPTPSGITTNELDS